MIFFQRCWNEPNQCYCSLRLNQHSLEPNRTLILEDPFQSGILVESLITYYFLQMEFHGLNPLHWFITSIPYTTLPKHSKTFCAINKIRCWKWRNCKKNLSILFWNISMTLYQKIFRSVKKQLPQKWINVYIWYTKIRKHSSTTFFDFMLFKDTIFCSYKNAVLHDRFKRKTFL